MRWELQLAVLLGLSFSDVASLAQRPPDDDGLAISASGTEADSSDAGYFDSDGVVRFQLIQGRLCLDPPQHRKGTQHSEREGVYESITVTAERGVPSVHYIHRNARHEIIVAVQHAEALRIESRLTGSSELAVIHQPLVRGVCDNQIHWTITPIDANQTRHKESQFEGATLLHLRSQDPKSFDCHFASLFRRLLRGQSLESLCERTEAAVINRIQTIDGCDVASIQDSVAQLASPKLAIRRAAERRLLSFGSTIVPIIRQLPQKDLDAEQVARLQEITSLLQPFCEDTPASLAAMLVNDAEHWAAMAKRMNADQIKMANRYLQQSGLKPVQGMESHEPIERVASNEAALY